MELNLTKELNQRSGRLFLFIFPAYFLSSLSTSTPLFYYKSGITCLMGQLEYTYIHIPMYIEAMSMYSIGCVSILYSHVAAKKVPTLSREAMF